MSRAWSSRFKQQSLPLGQIGDDVGSGASPTTTFVIIRSRSRFDHRSRQIFCRTRRDGLRLEELPTVVRRRVSLAGEHSLHTGEVVGSPYSAHHSLRGNPGFFVRVGSRPRPDRRQQRVNFRCQKPAARALIPVKWSARHARRGEGIWATCRAKPGLWE